MIIGSSGNLEKSNSKYNIIKEFNNIQKLNGINDLEMITFNRPVIIDQNRSILIYPINDLETFEDYINNWNNNQQLDEWVSIVQHTCYLYNQIYILNNEYNLFINGISEDSIIFNGNKLHLTDYLKMTDGQIFGIDNDLLQVIYIIHHLIKLGYNNIELSKWLNKKNIKTYNKLNPMSPKELYNNSHKLCQMVFTPIENWPIE